MAALTYLSVTSALMVGAVNAGPAMERHLREARSVLGGYIHELTREAPEGTRHRGSSPRTTSDSIQHVRELGGFPERCPGHGRRLGEWRVDQLDRWADPCRNRRQRVKVEVVDACRGAGEKVPTFIDSESTAFLPVIPSIPASMPR